MGFSFAEPEVELGPSFLERKPPSLGLGRLTYDTALAGRMQPDPIGFNGKDINLYTYVWNNPVLRTDSLGLIDDSVSQTAGKPGPLGDFAREELKEFARSQALKACREAEAKAAQTMA